MSNDQNHGTHPPARSVFKISAILVVVLLIYLAATRGPYFYPTSVSLGPCLPDWTTPLSYTVISGERASPMGSARADLGDGGLLVCYGRPSARGRPLFGEPDALVPYDRIWRTGANEPTRLFTNVDLDIAGLHLESGRYSMYTIPGDSLWTIIFNASTFHWGNEFTESVLDQEVGRTTVAADSSADYAEQFTISVDAANDEPTGIIELAWGHLRVPIPVRSLGN